MPLDLSRDIVLRWDNPEPAHVALFKHSGITAVLHSLQSILLKVREASSVARTTSGGMMEPPGTVTTPIPLMTGRKPKRCRCRRLLRQ